MGKTKVIEVLAARYEGVVAVQTFVGTMAIALQERGIAVAETLHRALHRRAKGTKEQYDQVRVLIWDEASNIDLALAAQTLARFPNLLRLVLVLDPEQIAPMGRGQLAMDLVKFFAGNCCTLAVTMRVDDNPESQKITSNDRAFMSRRVDDMQWTELPSVPAPGSAPLGPGVYHVDYSNETELRRLIRTTVQTWCPTRQGRMFLTLTNAERKLINETVDQELTQKNVPLFFQGQQITIVGRNYPRKGIDATVAAMQKKKKRGGGGGGVQKKRNSKAAASDAVSDGDIFELDYLTFYDTLTKSYRPDKERQYKWQLFIGPEMPRDRPPLLPVVVTNGLLWRTALCPRRPLSVAGP